jgi:hypothetical protein
VGGTPLRDLELLKWCRDLVEAMFPVAPSQAAADRAADRAAAPAAR